MTAFYGDFLDGGSLPRMTRFTLPLMHNLWIFPAAIAVLIGFILVIVCQPRRRRTVQWRLPAFREAKLANTASTIWLLLKNGIPLPDALKLVAQLETNEQVRDELSGWLKNLAGGAAKFSAVASGGKIFPPLFVWLVSSAGEDMSAGFKQTSEIYQARAEQRSEMLMHAALPVMILLLGLIILMQGWILLSSMLPLISCTC
jgi:type II secretory pathway component PulF